MKMISGTSSKFLTLMAIAACCLSFVALAQARCGGDIVKGVCRGTFYYEDDTSTLNGITEITDNLVLYVPLRNTSDANDLLTIGGGMSIRELIDKVPYIAGFYNLQSIGEDLTIQDTSDLAYLNGFYSLESIGGNFLIGGFNRRNTGLVNVTGFNALATVGGQFLIFANPLLERVPHFNALTKTGLLSITSNANLQFAPDMESLETTDSMIQMDFNGFTELTGFNSLKTAKTIYIRNNDNLLNINAFQQLTSATILFIWLNPVLEKVDGFDSIKTLTNIELATNPNLENINFASGLSGRIDRVTFTGNDKLTNKDFCVLVNIDSGIGKLSSKSAPCDETIPIGDKCGCDGKGYSSAAARVASSFLF
eukprot:TRINITY_DN6227_c0_g1_i2.p1 TRINITY_DN6227_c0_g1~~TRINITY_DN6227_c0_g1_i2.p1  ORF type:complete len:366 (+),score=41.30 TRINITY_DN6227_c0_g1_i2:67-1164(+)